MKNLLAFVFSLLLPTFACAAPPSAESVDHLLSLVHAEKTLESLFQTMDGLMKGAVNRSLPTPSNATEQQQVADAYTEKFVLSMKEELSWDKMKPLYVQIYVESFSQEEIDGLTGFYASPVGQAYVDKLPVVMHKTMALTQARVVPIMLRIQQALKQDPSASAATP